MATADHAGAVLTVDLDAIAANYQLLCDRLGPVACAAVLKANAYGLGLDPVAHRLAREGCRIFFVAQLAEAVALRAALGDAPDDDEAAVFVLNGLHAGAERDHLAWRAFPVLNTPEQAAAWAAFARAEGRPLPAILHIDTGMARLGMTAAEAAALAADGTLSGLELRYVMSHLACAGDADDPMNAMQLAAFRSALSPFPGTRASLANSSGIFLGAEYHFDLARSGAALMGLAPLAGHPNPLRQPVFLQGKILQVQRVDTGKSVGYGASHRVVRDSRIATVAVGYGDGYLRSLGNRGNAYIGEFRVPVVGRVSMDLITLDVTDVPGEACRPGAMAELIGPHHSPDALAAEAGTIGYEILTALGHRYVRRYLGGDSGA